MKVENCTKEDYLNIIDSSDEFWNNTKTKNLHHPMFIHEFGNTAYIAKDDNMIVGYLFGFISQTEPMGYIHLVATRNGYRRNRYASLLYSVFIEYCRLKKCKKIKAITSPENEHSIQFHQKLGFKQVNSTLSKNYTAWGEDRLIFEMVL